MVSLIVLQQPPNNPNTYLDVNDVSDLVNLKVGGEGKLSCGKTVPPSLNILRPSIYSSHIQTQLTVSAELSREHIPSSSAKTFCVRHDGLRRAAQGC